MDWKDRGAEKNGMSSEQYVKLLELTKELEPDEYESLLQFAEAMSMRDYEIDQELGDI